MIVAIDPGASGGLAWEGCAVPMPDTEREIVDLLRDLRAAAGTAYIEKVGGFIGAPQPGSAMFKFGRNVGVLHGALLAFGYKIIEVAPQTWQKALSLGNSTGMSKQDWKNKLKAVAGQRYPHLSPTLKTADALLILEYARKQP